MDKKRLALKWSARAQGERKGEVMVYSVIEPYRFSEDDPAVTSRDFDAALKALGDVDEITVRINSPGGAVWEAAAMRTALMKHPAAKVIDIEGVCASAATMIACLPGALVRMGRGGEYMIHRASLIAMGNAEELGRAIESLNVTDGNLAKIYAERTGMTPEECFDMMKAETWMDADEAKEAGFVDEIIGDEGGVSEMVAQADPDALDFIRTQYARASDEEARVAALGISACETDMTADAPTVNISSEGETDMDVTTMTAEEFERLNPSAASEIASRAVAAERERIQQIDDLTPPGQSWAEEARAAKANGVSAQDFFKGIVKKQREQASAYLEARAQETAPAAQIAGGDSADNDGRDAAAMEDKAAADIAAFAKGADAAIEMA